MAQQDTKPYRDLSARTNWLKAILVLNALVLGIAALFNFYALRAFQAYDVVIYSGASGPMQNRLGVAYFTATAATYVFLAISFVFFALWIYRANSNLHALGASIRSPFWSVGGYLIPIIHLWLGYQAMVEVEKASRNPHAWRNQKSPSLLTLWWLFLVVGNGFNSVGDMLSAPLNYELYLTGYAFAIASRLALILLITRIARMQADLEVF